MTGRRGRYRAWRESARVAPTKDTESANDVKAPIVKRHNGLTLSLAPPKLGFSRAPSAGFFSLGTDPRQDSRAKHPVIKESRSQVAGRQCSEPCPALGASH